MQTNLNPCPFCKGTSLGYSLKTFGAIGEGYYGSIFCKECHCYGPRARKVYPVGHFSSRKAAEKDPDLRAEAERLWNGR